MLKRLFFLLALLIAGPAAAETLVVQAGHLITDPARPEAGPSTITIVDGRIQGIAPGLNPAPPGARLIDLSTKTVLPGLIDAHVHLTSVPGEPFWQEAVNPPEYYALIGAHNALVTARAGFTTVRDLGSGRLTGFPPRRAINQGPVPRPRLRPPHRLRPSPRDQRGACSRPAHARCRRGPVDHRRPWRRLRLPPRGR